MLADRTKKWKAGFMLIVLMMVCVGSGGCGNSSSKDPLQDPTAVTTPDGEVIHYGDTQESVEKILGMEITGGNEHFPEYEDRTEAFYREKNGEYHMAYIHIRESSYTTYQGIRVGDNWEEVREKLNSDLTAETFSGARIVFDNGKQINANTDQDEWEEDWLVLGYVYNTEGDIISISVLDVKAFNFQ